jgi:PPOX class probable F420-dependent enzyme
MAKKRDRIRMTDEEVRAFLARGKTLQLATIGPDGAPHLVAMWYGIRDDGKLVIETFEKAQKAVNLRRDPRLSVLVESGTEYDQLRGVSIRGRAEIVEAPDDVKAVMRLVLARNHPGLEGEAFENAVEMGARKRVAFVIHPERVISWDHTKLGGAY